MKIKYFILLLGLISQATLTQEKSLYYDLVNTKGTFPVVLNNMAARYLFANDSALDFWLSIAQKSLAHGFNNEVITRKYPYKVDAINNLGNRFIIKNHQTDQIFLTDESGNAIKTFIRHWGQGFSSTGKFFTITNRAREAFIFLSESGELINKFPFRPGQSFSSDDKFLISFLPNYKKVYVYEIETGKEMQFACPANIRYAHLNHDNSKLLACAADKVIVFDVKSGTSQIITDQGHNQVMSAEFHPTQDFILTQKKDGSVTIWNLKDNSQYLNLPVINSGNHEIKIEMAQFAFFGKYIICILQNKDLTKNSNNITRELAIFDFQTKKIRNQIVNVHTFELNESKTRAIISHRPRGWGEHDLLDIGSGLILAQNIDGYAFVQDKLVKIDDKDIKEFRLYDQAIKNNILESITLDQAQILIESYRDYKQLIPSQRSSNALFSLPLPFKFALASKDTNYLSPQGKELLYKNALQELEMVKERATIKRKQPDN